MAARKSGLGRGLDALIPVDRPASGFAELPIEDISPNPQQPREDFAEDALEELAASIREVGILQPIVVRADEDDGSYTLIAGERRLRAAQLAGIELIPAMIRSGGDDQGQLVEALVENVQREDLSPLEEAAAYSHLLEDFAMTHEQVAQRVGKSRSSVTNTLRLLQLPAQLQGLLERGDLSAGHARALLAIEDEAFAVHIGQRAAAEGWSVRRVEEAVKARQAEAPKPVVEKVRPAEIIELEQRLAEHLETKVKIDYGKRGGKVIVRFRSLDDLERLYRQLLD